MSCYCANYYGHINCRNQVARFGDRCKLCLALRSGASLSTGLLPAVEDDAWASKCVVDRSAVGDKRRETMRTIKENMGYTARTESRFKGQYWGA